MSWSGIGGKNVTEMKELSPQPFLRDDHVWKHQVGGGALQNLLAVYLPK